MNLRMNSYHNTNSERSNILLRLFRVFPVKGKAEMVLGKNPDDSQELIESIRNARKDWINANMNFEFAEESDLIDYYTYNIKACQLKYEFLIKKAKEKGIRVEPLKTSEGLVNEQRLALLD